jgi:hypothetical protein
MENCEGEFDKFANPRDCTPSVKAGITTIPNELFEMIIGAIAFVDLPYFLQTSKQINVLPPRPLPVY